MSLKKWKLISTKTIFKSKYITLKDNSYQIATGQILDHYYHIDRPDYVAIVATNDKNEILIEKQYRRGVNDFVYEIPAGFIDPGESPLISATREIKEETGYDVKSIKLIGEFYPIASFSSMKGYVFKAKLSSIEGKTYGDGDEEIETQFVSIGKLKNMIIKGEFKCMSSLTAIFLSGILTQ